MLSIKINGLEFLVNNKLSVLEACSFAGIYIPRFCYNENLSIAGNCRMCLVEVEKIPKPVASCAMPLSPNMAIFTDSPAVKKARENVLEALLLNHPLDCPICDQAGECDLQDQAKLFGNTYTRFFNTKRAVEDKPYGLFIKTVMTRCIHCTRCVRFSDEIAGVPAFGTFNRGTNTEIGGYTTNIFNSEISGTVIDLCPVGALTAKPYAFKYRSWELRCQETIDFTDGLGTPIIVNFKESDIIRIQPKVEKSLQNVYISDKIRFSFDAQKKNRIQQIFLKDKSNNSFKISKTADFLSLINTCILEKKNLTVIINENTDFQTLNFLKLLDYNLKNINIVSLSNTCELSSDNIYNSSIYENLDVLDTKTIKHCFLLSVNLKIESVILNLKLKLKYNQQVLKVTGSGFYNKSNYPIIFINLLLDNILKNFEGKTNFSIKLINQTNNLLIIGNSMANRIQNVNTLYFLLKQQAPSLIIFKNQVRLNSLGLKNANIKTLNINLIKKADVIFCVNLDDTILLRKQLVNKNFYWFNTHGSSLALKSNLIFPLPTVFEQNLWFLNLENKLKKTVKIVVNNVGGVFSILNTKFDKYPTFLRLLFLFNLKLENKTLNFLNYLTDEPIKSKPLFYIINTIKKTSILKNVIKPTLKDFFLDNTYTKNSIILSQRSQEIRKLHNNFD
jgi:NADH-quinone oxidoreductase chain G